MIALIAVGVVLAVIIMEFVVSPRLPDYLYYQYSFDTTLAEPDEKIVYSDKVINGLFWPILYISFSIALPRNAVISDNGRNTKGYRISLLPYHASRHTIIFSFPRRGVYKGGRYFMETGDFLGFKSFVRSSQIADKITVMPRKCEDEMVLKTLGGYIGDISVKRFIIEDPILTMGFRDYTGHEPMKKISWPQSVRTGKLVVKNYDYTVDANVAVVLNLASGSLTEKEKSLEIARTVCEELEKQHIPYKFMSNGDVKDRQEGFGRRHLETIMEDLGKSKLCAYTSFDSLMSRCIQERKDNRGYIIISAPLSPEGHLSYSRLVKFCDFEPCILEAEVI